MGNYKYKILEERRNEETQVSIIMDKLDHNDERFKCPQKAKTIAHYLYRNYLKEVKTHIGTIKPEHIKAWDSKRLDEDVLEIARTGKLRGKKPFTF